MSETFSIPQEFRGEAIRLTDDDGHEVALSIGCEPAALAAVLAVESVGNGFLRDGRPVILFEHGTFSARTDSVFDAVAPAISRRDWGSGYGPLEHQYARLAEAMDLDREEALSSCSWGLGQVMGFNWDMLGYSSIDDFVGRTCHSERYQLDAMIEYITAAGLVRSLAIKDWTAFARGYNGPGQPDHYASRLAHAYGRAVGVMEGAVPEPRLLVFGSRGPDLAAVQSALNQHCGPPLLEPDGIWGPKTEAVLRTFQQANDLRVDGIVGVRTRKALGLGT